MLTLEHCGSGQLFYATEYSAGFDICANEHKMIEPSQRAVIKTGLRITEAVVVPESTLIGGQAVRLVPELQIRPRSGLALKHGLTILNSPSTIDADYRGEILLIIINHGQEQFVVSPGDRMAQGVCALAIQIPGLLVKPVVRGEGGFGSTGV